MGRGIARQPRWPVQLAGAAESPCSHERNILDSDNPKAAFGTQIIGVEAGGDTGTNAPPNFLATTVTQNLYLNFKKKIAGINRVTTTRRVQKC